MYGTMWCVENSLKTLKIDSIDLLLVHDPDRFCRDGMNSVIQRRGALEAFERLKEQGVIKSIGLGQRRHDFHRIAIESGRFDVILIYDDYHPLNLSARDWLLPLAKDYDVGVLNGSPMSHGLLCGADPDGINQNQIFDSTPEKIRAAKRFYRWCQEQGVSMGAVIFQLRLRESSIHCTLSGASTCSELEQNLQVG